MKLLIGIPSYQPGSVATVALLQALNRKKSFLYREAVGSLLTLNHNQLLATALNARNEGVTHLLILHSDVSPVTEDWLDVLCDESEKAEADVISAVIPIKDNLGITSTALDIGENIWKPVRLTLRNVSELPTTFTADKLLLNTGMMLIDVRKPWIEQDVLFHIDDCLEKDAQGVWSAKVASEDWNFSRMAAHRGAKLYATSAIRLGHYGTSMYQSHAIWGSEVDPLQDARREHIFIAPDGEIRVIKV